MTGKPLLRLFQVSLGVTLGLAVVLLWLQNQEWDGGQLEAGGTFFLPEPLKAPSFTLTSHEGTRVSLEEYSGRIRIVFFGYTSCPDVCPLTLSNLTRAFGQMEEHGQRIQVFLVTVDPHRDTPERLAGYLSNFHPSFLGLTGTREEIRFVANGFGAYFSEPSGEENYTVDHTARIFVVDRYGRIPLTFPVTAKPEEMARDLLTLFEISGG